MSDQDKERERAGIRAQAKDSDLAEKQRQYLQKISDDEELDSTSSSDVETDNQDSSSQIERNFPRTFDYIEFICGLIIGLFIGLITSTIISNE